MTRLRLFIVGKARNGKVLCKRYSLDGDAPLWSFEIETLGM